MQSFSRSAFYLGIAVCLSLCCVSAASNAALNDDDDDGVLNNVDQCPFTPEEEVSEVNEVGCAPSERDTDGDGVVDSEDTFPFDSTETRDDDQDGVGNNGDQCLNTSADRSVLSNGCAFISGVEQLGSDLEVNGALSYRQMLSISGDGRTLAILSFDYSLNAPVIRVYQWTERAWSKIGSDINPLEPGAMGLPRTAISLSKDGSTLAVGNSRNYVSGSNEGQVTIYRKEGLEWVQRGPSLQGEGPSDEFGFTVAVSSDGNTIAAGATGFDDRRGEVRVYRWTGESWSKMSKSLSSVLQGESSGDQFGFALSMASDGKSLVVGAPFNDGYQSQKNNSGHARYYYVGSSGTWNKLGPDIDGEADLDLFGNSLALSGNGQTIAAGAPRKDIAGVGESAGRAYVFRHSGSLWRPVGDSLDGAGGSNPSESDYAADFFGESLALSYDGNILAVGAPGYRNGADVATGQVKMFEWAATENVDSAGESVFAWIEFGEEFYGSATNGLLGRAIAMSDDGYWTAFRGADFVRIFHRFGQDSDEDGISDEMDFFPLDPNETTDSDNDGIGDNADEDIDGDGVPNENDAFPLDPFESVDTDSDGIGNNADEDDDDDGVLDESDAFPLDPTETVDTDDDGVGNNSDTDDDGDGVPDSEDAFPLDAAETLDTDQDGIGNNADTDDDDDGVIDESDAFPLDATETLDTDSDGIGNNADSDDDGDGVLDVDDDLPLDPTESVDSDGDGIGDNSDSDIDGDGVANTDDACPTTTFRNQTLANGCYGIWTETFAVNASIESAQTGFAIATSTDGKTVAYSAPRATGATGADAGQVTVYQETESGWQVLGQTIEGSATGERHGYSLAFNSTGDVLAVGATLADGGAIDTGRVRVYALIEGEWQQKGSDLVGANANDYAGWSVALSASGDTVAIGSPFADQGAVNAGALTIYDWDGNDWQERGERITSSTSDARLGYSIALSADGNTVIAGAPSDSSNGTSAGSAWVYQWDGANWQALGSSQLGTSVGDSLGTAVAISADAAVIAIASPSADTDELTDAGEVTIYRWQDDDWLLETALTGTSATEYFGQHIALSTMGDAIAVGAPGNATGGAAAGAVSVYSRRSSSEADTWALYLQSLTSAQANAQLGTSVALAGDGQRVIGGSPAATIDTPAITLWDALSDRDEDGVVDINDELPLDPGDSIDTDGDGIGNNTDTDDDDDGVLDESDAFPLDPTETVDTDDDGVGNNSDTDDDGDGVPDSEDAFPLDAAETLDTDQDGIGNNADTDDDGDGTPDSQDGAPLDPTDTVDTDGDGIGDNTDMDDDGDGVADLDDKCPFTSLERQVLSNGCAFTLFRQLGADIYGDADGDQAGYSIALSDNGDTVAIGARRNDTNGEESGHVRMWRWDGVGWSSLGAAISGEGKGDWSGYSVSLSSDGHTVAIGAALNNGNGSASGHVRVYSWTGSEWLQQGSDIDGEAANDYSGSSVSLSSDGLTVAIGANGNDGGGAGSGHVRVYSWIDNAWIQLGSDIDGEAPDDRSGRPLSLSGDGRTVAIGAYTNDGNAQGAGHVRVYSWAGNHWSQLGSDIDGDSRGDLFGSYLSLASDGHTLAINAPNYSGSAGLVRVFKLTDGSWSQFGADIVGLGYGVSLSGDGSLLAAKGSGTKVYEWDSEWSELGPNIPGGGDPYISRDGSTLAIANPQFSGNSPGYVSIFEISKVPLQDSDEDGVPDTLDNDDDGDGVLDTNDAFPLDPRESSDTDSDGLGDNADTDDDGDGVIDTEDDFPLDSAESVDTDGDGVGDNADAFPGDASETTDTDGDGVGNHADSDDDGDGYSDSTEIAAGTDPLSSESFPSKDEEDSRGLPIWILHMATQPKAA